MVDPMVKARTSLVLTRPFFGTLSLQLKLIADPDTPTASTNGVNIRYNPKWVSKLQPKMVEGLLAHEIMHCAFLHHIRKGAREDKRWNHACDYNINDFLLQNGFILPPEGLHNRQEYPATMSVDEIYIRIPPPDEAPKWGTVTPAPQGSGQSEDDPSPAQQEATWKQAVTMAAHVARMQGKLPAGISELIDGLLAPKIPWIDIFRRWVSEPAKDDYSWARPNRRYLAQKLFMPSMWSERVGEIVYAIDTSGSMSTEVLREAATEADSLHREVRPTKTVVMMCDAAVHRVDEFGPDDEVVFNFAGRGGTDFRPVFDEIEKRNYTPKCLVFFTDGYGSFPETPPEYPVLWIMTEDVVPPFGDTIHVTPT